MGATRHRSSRGVERKTVCFPKDLVRTFYDNATARNGNRRRDDRCTYLARRVEEFRQFALRDGGDGGGEVLDPEILHAEAVERLERADAEEAAADAFGAEVGERHVADVIIHVGRVWVGLVWLGVELVEADERRMAAVGGIARADCDFRVSLAFLRRYSEP